MELDDGGCGLRLWSLLGLTFGAKRPLAVTGVCPCCVAVSVSPLERRLNGSRSIMSQ